MSSADASAGARSPARNRKTIRPTADRLRESLFNILAHAFDDPVTGARVLDLFAGTGAIGIEAISRGAEFVLFVDQGAEARALLRENVAALGLGGVSRIFRRDATKLGEAHPVAPFSLAFLDPPYGQGLAAASARLGARGSLVHSRRAYRRRGGSEGAIRNPEGFNEIDRRRYDDTEFVFLRAS